MSFRSVLTIASLGCAQFSFAITLFTWLEAEVLIGLRQEIIIGGIDSHEHIVSGMENADD